MRAYCKVNSSFISLELNTTQLSDEYVNLQWQVMLWLQLRFDHSTTTRLRSDYGVLHAPASIWRDSTQAKN